MRPAPTPILAALALALPAKAQVPDMTVLDIGPSIAFWGTAATGQRAYSFSTRACNEGEAALPWIDQEVHIAQNLFRVGAGRVEQLGYSWLQLGVCATNELGCGACQATACSSLGAGCATTRSAFTNDGMQGHDKADIDPTLGRFLQAASTPSGGSQAGRLLVDPALMGQTGYAYLAEVQYVYEGDAQLGDSRDNVSWRALQSSPTLPSLSVTGVARRHLCAVEAWQELQGDVAVVEVVNLAEPTRQGDALGHYVLGYAVTQVDNNSWRYEYALQNLTSHQAAASFTLPLGCGVDVSSASFRGVERHSGTPWDDTPWNITVDQDLVWQSTEDHGSNPDANALRWGELFNFSFVADAPPQASSVSIGLFLPGETDRLIVPVAGPCSGAVQFYCETSPNSLGPGTTLSVSGSTSVGSGDFTLNAFRGPSAQFGLFFYGADQTNLPFGDGRLCVAAGPEGLFRLGPPQTFGGSGFTSRPLDFSSPPAGSGPGQIEVGSTWNFQLWYRDPAAQNTGFNLSDAVSVTFAP